MRLSSWVFAGAALAIAAVLGATAGLGLLHIVAQLIAKGAG